VTYITSTSAAALLAGWCAASGWLAGGGAGDATAPLLPRSSDVLRRSRGEMLSCCIGATLCVIYASILREVLVAARLSCLLATLQHCLSVHVYGKRLPDGAPRAPEPRCNSLPDWRHRWLLAPSAAYQSLPARPLLPKASHPSPAESTPVTGAHTIQKCNGRSYMLHIQLLPPYNACSTAFKTTLRFGHRLTG
jgi:hypothetical protein